MVDATDRLLRDGLRETQLLLEGVGEEWWASKMRGELCGTANPSTILSWFGGMGSLNDLMLCRANGHLFDAEDEVELNGRLRALTSRMFELARRAVGNGERNDRGSKR